jgi:hypothetical protein
VKTGCNLIESSKDGYGLRKGCSANDDDDCGIGLETVRAMKQAKPMKLAADADVPRI